MYAVCKDGEYKYLQYIRTVYIQTNCMNIDIALRDHLIQDTPHGALYTLTIIENIRPRTLTNLWKHSIVHRYLRAWNKFCYFKILSHIFSDKKLLIYNSSTTCVQCGYCPTSSYDWYARNEAIRPNVIVFTINWETYHTLPPTTPTFILISCHKVII